MKLLIVKLINFYTMVLIAYAIMTWFPSAISTPIGKLLYRLSRPYLNIFSNMLPTVGGISFEVIVGVTVLRFIQNFILSWF